MEKWVKLVGLRWRVGLAGPWVAAHFVVLVVAGPWVAIYRVIQMCRGS